MTEQEQTTWYRLGAVLDGACRDARSLRYRLEEAQGLAGKVVNLALAEWCRYRFEEIGPVIARLREEYDKARDHFDGGPA